MRALRCNADYEAELFQGRTSSKLTESIEYLAFFLEAGPVLTRKAYAPEYLRHVAQVTGHAPALVRSGEASNWWGPLANLPLERELNSKLTSAALVIERGWCERTRILLDGAQIPRDLPAPLMVAKAPDGMSGQRFLMVSKETISELRPKLPVVLEPFLDRVHDFSHYVFPDGRTIAYQNVIDGNFQYRGTVFTRRQAPTLETLSFYHEVPPAAWAAFREALGAIIQRYQTPELGTGFSVDSFVYREGGELRIRPLSEVNFRKTMGLLCYLLSEKLFPAHPWSMTIIGKPFARFGGFPVLKDRLRSIPETGDGKVVLLSPGDARFEVFFLSSPTAAGGRELLRRVARLLPEAQLLVEF